MNRIVLATGNLHKLREVRSALSGLDGFATDAQPTAIVGAEETGVTFMENAVLKAVHVSRLVDDLVLADDSGLCVDALDGRPGVLSARYADGDAARIQRILSEMSAVPDGRRTAAFVCALALAQRGSVIWQGEGQVDGTIDRVASGSNGFGYDPIFRVPEYNRTMAELTAVQKDQTSHRGRALVRLMNFLRQR